MGRCSTIVFCVFNSVILVFSLILVGSGFSSLVHSHHGKPHPSSCFNFNQQHVFAVGLSLLVVSVLGFIACFKRVTAFLWVYSAFVFLFIIGLFVFTIFAFRVTSGGTDYHVHSGAGSIKEYRLGDYSQWLQKYVVSGESWRKMRTCLSDSNICAIRDLKESPFYPIQSGCCKPPRNCGFMSSNVSTIWELPPLGPSVPDRDCTTWSNQQTKLCYDCDSCKAGTLAIFKMSWRTLVLINSTIIIILIIFCTTAAYWGYRSKYGRHNIFGGYVA